MLFWMALWVAIIGVFGVFVLAVRRASGVSWTLTIAAIVLAVLSLAGLGPNASTAVLVAVIAIGGLLNYPNLRRGLVSNPLLAAFRRVLPPMSQTEREAIDAGSVWWDGELFSGKPDWERLLAVSPPRLNSEESAFLGNECEELCRMIDDWDSTALQQDVSPHAWKYIKDHGFLGMIIPKQYGGKGFSAYMHSQVVQKLASRSSAACVHVMVPNSLGPAELLLHYGTREQKTHYLPRLARGEDIPCFGLTNPNAGSDAAAIPDTGVVCRGHWNGEEILGMRVTWEKRYITLGPIATLLGLAFRLHDPEHLLGDEEDLGITCALIPTDTPGVDIGRRHMPLNAVFQNGPNWGKDVFMPLEWIIGGPKMAGQGWRMLMECLAAGRSISLPSSACGYAKIAVRATGGYARVRSQFKTPIGRFEGVEEALARMGGNLYMMDAARRMTAGAIDMGEKPSVISAIVKYHLTERGRAVVNDAMDVLGGKGICLGPANLLGRPYQQLPIAITVEGANILTRSLIIFGQGAIRCHPYVLAERRATTEPDRHLASKDFDRALWGHVSFAVSNTARAFLHGISGSRLAWAPSKAAAETRRYYRHLNRFSACLAFLADIAMLTLGGSLKRREKLSARLGDVLSMLYLASATLKRYEDEGRREEDLPMLHWSVQDALFRIQFAFDGVIENFPSRGIARFIKCIVFPLGRRFRAPSDKLGHEIASLLITPSEARDRLTAGMHIPADETEALGAIEAALAAAIECDPVEQKIRGAVKNSLLSADRPERLADAALSADVISKDERAMLARSQALRDEVIRVDHFPQDVGRSEYANSAAVDLPV